jgi:hypothetical protein
MDPARLETVRRIFTSGLGEPSNLAAERCERCQACLPDGIDYGQIEMPALFRCLAAVRPRRVELIGQLNPSGERGVADAGPNRDAGSHPDAEADRHA